MRRLLIVIFLGGSIIACKKHANPPAPAGKAILIYPDNNSACITGTVVSSTLTSINFSWQRASDATQYTLVITDLLTNKEYTASASQPGSTVQLPSNTPFSWYVISKSTQTNTQVKSDVWKFYNSGPGITSHPPFPPHLISPIYNEIVTPPAGIIKLNWDAEDVDDDLTSYDIYFGTTTTPGLLQTLVPTSPQAGLVGNVINNVSVEHSTTYYWRVVAKDSKGNTATSELSAFKIN